MTTASHRGARTAKRLGAAAAASLAIFMSGAGVQPLGAAPAQLAASCAAAPDSGNFYGPDSLESFGPQIQQALLATAIPLLLPGDVTAPATLAPGGGSLTYDASFTLDLEALAGAARQLAIPQLADSLGGTPEDIEPGFGLELNLTDLALRFPAPAGTTFTGTPTAEVTGTGAPSVAASIVDNSLLLEFGEIEAGAYGALVGEEFQLPPFGPITISFSVTTTVPAGTSGPIQLKAGPADVVLALGFGLGVLDDPEAEEPAVVDLIRLGWENNPASCTPDGAVLAETLIVDPNATTTTAPVAPVTAQPRFTG